MVGNEDYSPDSISHVKRDAQRGQRERTFHRAIQRPTDHAAQVRVQNHGQEHELVVQPDVGDIGPPELTMGCAEGGRPGGLAQGSASYCEDAEQAALCREFQISLKTGYKTLER